MNISLKIFFICIFFVSNPLRAYDLQKGLAAHIQNIDLIKISQDIELIDEIFRLNTIVFRSTTSKIYSDHANSIVYIQTDVALGSGVVINDNGDVLTNAHIIADANEVFVVFKPEKGLNVPISQIHEAKIIKIDRSRDLALIQPLFPPPTINPITILESESVNDDIVGSTAHCIGHPDGLTWTYTKGIVSSYRENYTWPYLSEKLASSEKELTDEEINIELANSQMHRANVIQTDCAINEGNSGGALINDDGNLVAINTFMLEGLQLVNFSVAANELNHFLKSDKFKEQVSVKKHLEMTGEPIFIEGEDTNGDGTYDKEIWDYDGNGMADVIFIDENYDGFFDLAIQDMNENGIVDGKITWSTTTTEKNYYFDIDEDGIFDAVFTDMDDDGDYEIKRKL